jgi:hypothetical protein
MARTACRPEPAIRKDLSSLDKRGVRRPEASASSLLDVQTRFVFRKMKLTFSWPKSRGA